MTRYTVKLKSTIYYNIEVEANAEADDIVLIQYEAERKFSDELNKINLPQPLEWGDIEAWEVEPHEPTISDVMKSIAESGSLE